MNKKDLKQIEDNYRSIISKEKPLLTQKSINQYARCLKLLHINLVNHDNLENYKFLKNTDNVEKFLSQYSLTTRRNYCTSIINLLETEENRDKDTIKYYEKITKHINNDYKKQNETGIISDKQSVNFVDIEQIDKLIELLKLNKETMGYIIFKILYHHHIRNELAELQVVELKRYKRMTINDKYNKNFLVVGSKKLFISRNGYKTGKIYGEIVFEIKDKILKRDLRKYLKTLTTDMLFTFPPNKDKRNQLANYMIYLSKKYIGVGISTTMMAKILLSHKYLSHKKKQQESADERGHSVSTENLVYIKSKE